MSIVSKLRQYKTIRLSGVKFKIKKINPLIDFTPDKMPQIFTSFQSQRKINPEQKLNESIMRRNLDDMRNMIIAGVIEPKIGSDIQIDDILCDNELSFKLYTEILVHSLNQFKGIKGLFFSIRVKHTIYMLWRKNMAEHQSKYLNQMEITP